MRYTTSSRKMILLTPIVATIAMALTIPFNMGGCADVASQIGGAVGGQQGAALGGGLGKGVEANDLGEKDERALGESVVMVVTTRHPITRNDKLSQYVSLVGLTLANASGRPDANWTFGVVESDEANAFSGPSGFIMVTTGLLKQMHDESELAGALAHEITHVTAHHGLKAAKAAKMTEAFATGAQAAVKDSQQAADFGKAVGGSLDVAVNKGYGRDQEDEADAGAVKLLIAAGYDPHGFLNFIERVAKAQANPGNTLMSTHPGAAQRATKIQAKIEAQKLATVGAVLKERFETNTR